jgi:hypothetical protein
MTTRHGDENRRRSGSCPLLCRLLDRTPSERSEASWSFYSMSERSNRSPERSIASAAERVGIDDESDQVT